jgi:hypothetical protein
MTRRSKLPTIESAKSVGAGETRRGAGVKKVAVTVKRATKIKILERPARYHRRNLGRTMKTRLRRKNASVDGRMRRRVNEVLSR